MDKIIKSNILHKEIAEKTTRQIPMPQTKNLDNPNADANPLKMLNNKHRNNNKNNRHKCIKAKNNTINQIR